VIAAIGKSGEPADRDLTSISIGGVLIASEGEAVIGYDETPVALHMKQKEIDIVVSVGVGTGKAVVYTTDLTHDYIDINADYRS
jgi:glutamate N-acetyltransferase/amino-acid N-acetyltransferase